MSIKSSLTGIIKAGEIEIECYHLDNDMRVISGAGMQKALGLTTIEKADGTRRKTAGNELKSIILSSKFKEKVPEKFISIDDIFTSQCIKFERKGGAGSASATHGFEATLLMDICHYIQDLQSLNILPEKYYFLYERATIISRSFAKVGIIALIDEATGYQNIREKDALQVLLDKYLSKELSAWAKRFPDEFYKEIFRLNSWAYNPMSVKRPSCIGGYTKDIVYNRLAPEIVKELEKKNPINEKGVRKYKHHQFLTHDIGHPALSQHIYGVIGLMRTQQTWGQFMRLLNRAYPVKTITDLFGEIE